MFSIAPRLASQARPVATLARASRQSRVTRALTPWVGAPAPRLCASSFSSAADPTCGTSKRKDPQRWTLALSAALAAGIVYWNWMRPVFAESQASALAPKAGALDMRTVEANDGKDGRRLWVVIKDEVYDLTDFIDQHPGGRDIIMKNGGRDVTEIYGPIHPPSAIEDAQDLVGFVGVVDPSTVKKQRAVLSDKELARREALENLPEVGSMLNLDDFEKVAQRILTDQAWAYYSSAGDDETSLFNNRATYSRVWFKPRVLVPVSKVDTTVRLRCLKGFEDRLALPFYISPAALAKLGHAEGELNLTRAAGKANIIQGISANASAGLGEMLGARVPGQAVIYQLYVNRDRRASERILSKIEAAGVNAVMLTVDAPVMGKRERDMRAKGEVVQTGGGAGGKADAGVAAAISGYIDADLGWSDIAWYRRHCSLPLILKGIQTVEDAKKAMEHGVEGIVLSNHGGRSLDYAPAPLDVLIKLREQAPEVLARVDVFIDGGIRRGTDVLKALALGAKSVGLGRPFLYAQSGFGEAGADRAIAILRDEIERGMRLLGITRLEQLTPEMVEVLPKVWTPPSPPHPTAPQ